MEATSMAKVAVAPSPIRRRDASPQGLEQAAAAAHLPPPAPS